MSLDPTQLQPSELAPGTTQVVVAGTIYVIRDNQGIDTEIEPRNDPLVITFIHAFDRVLHMQKIIPETQHETSDEMRRAHSELEIAWRNLPMYLAKDFPSVKKLYVPVGNRDQ